MHANLEAVVAREEEVAREWTWLIDALNSVARARAEQGDAHAFRLLQHQAVRVGQRRVELMLQRAALEGDTGCSSVTVGLPPAS